jgi:hypothetical protein
MGETAVPMKELAQKLLAWEGHNGSDSNLGANAPVRVIEKLRTLLTRFAGPDGFAALLRRATVLSGMDESSASAYKIGKDASTSFDGLSEESILTLTANLLDLMSTFIGKSLTLTLLSEVWPLDE